MTVFPPDIYTQCDDLSLVRKWVVQDLVVINSWVRNGNCVYFILGNKTTLLVVVYYFAAKSSIINWKWCEMLGLVLF